MIRQVIREELRAFGDRIIYFLMRVAFSAEMGRQLITNVLKQFFIGSEEKEKAYTDLVNESHKTAQKNVIAIAPLIKMLVEKWKKTHEK